MRRLILSILVVGGAVGLAGWKRHTHTAPSVARAVAPRVLLYADLSEADSSCACGELIRTVRSARSRGVTVQELDAREAGSAVKEHRLLVSPTVVFLAPDGAEQGRFEGEGAEALKGTRSGLARLEARQ